jgi:hypothetical protein
MIRIFGLLPVDAINRAGFHGFFDPALRASVRVHHKGFPYGFDQTKDFGADINANSAADTGIGFNDRDFPHTLIGLVHEKGPSQKFMNFWL